MSFAIRRRYHGPPFWENEPCSPRSQQIEGSQVQKSPNPGGRVFNLTPLNLTFILTPPVLPQGFHHLGFWVRVAVPYPPFCARVSFSTPDLSFRISFPEFPFRIWKFRIYLQQSRDLSAAEQHICSIAQQLAFLTGLLHVRILRIFIF